MFYQSSQHSFFSCLFHLINLIRHMQALPILTLVNQIHPKDWFLILSGIKCFCNGEPEPFKAVTDTSVSSVKVIKNPDFFKIVKMSGCGGWPRASARGAIRQYYFNLTPKALSLPLLRGLEHFFGFASSSQVQLLHWFKHRRSARNCPLHTFLQLPS